MHIYIMRHGEAGFNAKSDELRMLTSVGKLQSASVAEQIVKTQSSIEQLLVSPYVRAKETAAELQKQITFKNQTTLNELTPSGDERFIKSYLMDLYASGVNSVMIVSHLPLVGYLVSEICESEPNPFFNTADVAKITMMDFTSQNITWFHAKI